MPTEVTALGHPSSLLPGPLRTPRVVESGPRDSLSKGILVVSLTSDDAIEKEDGIRPYVPQELRAETLAAVELVDYVVIAEQQTAEPVIALLKPDVYVKGKEYDDSSHPGFLAERRLVENLGGRVVFSSGEVVFPRPSCSISTCSPTTASTSSRGFACAASAGASIGRRS